MTQGLRITQDQLQDEIDRGLHGGLEHALLALLSDIKIRERGADVFVKVEFPADGGLALECRRGKLGSLLWWITKPVRLWWT